MTLPIHFHVVFNSNCCQVIFILGDEGANLLWYPFYINDLCMLHVIAVQLKYESEKIYSCIQFFKRNFGGTFISLMRTPDQTSFSLQIYCQSESILTPVKKLKIQWNTLIYLHLILWIATRVWEVTSTNHYHILP